MSSPDGGQFPPGMKVLQFPRNLTFHPENGEHSLLINSPEPGNWFLLAYINKKEKTDYVQEVCYCYVLVIGRTPFCQKSSGLEHHYLNLEQTRTCSSFSDRTITSYFWLE